ncbi:MAG: thiamine pyrophosphate-binding protein [Phocaeicola sp.]
MKQRVADYIADFMAANGIKDVFTITGGGAMHLNDAFGHHTALKCTYNHHEQASAIAAEAYARLSNEIALVCVTSGPGGTNAITGVVGGWLDSIPMFVISGQVKYETTVDFTALPMRQLGDQEFYITRSVACMTKYAVMVTEADTIAYHLEKAMYLAKNGRPGPVWLDIPLNVQGAIIDTDNLTHFDKKEIEKESALSFSEEEAREIISRIEQAKAPVIFAGSGIRVGSAHKEFIELIEKLQIPVVTAWNAHDLLWDNHSLYCGRPGTIGNRGGNFVVQNADLLLVLGSRLNIRQISYNWENFAKKAYKIIVDIDPVELKKPTISPDMAVCADVRIVMKKLLSQPYQQSNVHAKWLNWSKNINAKYPIVQSRFFTKQTPVNPYAFFNQLFLQLKQDDVVVASNGSACVCSFQSAIIQEGQRLFTNSGCASMGYGLPAAIGAALCTPSKRVICLEGDGSIQMNIQELQTVVHNKLGLKIFWLNNDGYHSIRQTQTNLFQPPLCGVNGPNGISFPQAEAIAKAYGINYFKIDKISTMDKVLKEVLKDNSAAIIEVIIDPEQSFEPKLSAKRLPDGKMVSPSLEDMFPFIPADEMTENIYN